ncbi:MAG: hypothetical protein GY941_21870 [Planctomycetes bacterium]|nr:hypothetical protein [Planctomycetota bacterium]
MSDYTEEELIEKPYLHACGLCGFYHAGYCRISGPGVPTNRLSWGCHKHKPDYLLLWRVVDKVKELETSLP